MIVTKENIDKLNALLDHGLAIGLGDPLPGQMCVEAAVCAASAVTRAANYAARATGNEKVLRDFAEGIVQILIDMKAPACAWLDDHV